VACSLVDRLDDVGVGGVAAGLVAARLPLLEHVLDVRQQTASFDRRVGGIALCRIQGEQLGLDDQLQGDRVTTADLGTGLAGLFVVTLDTVTPPSVSAFAAVHLQVVAELAVKGAVGLGVAGVGDAT